jgi:hypothetical protein
MVDNPFKHLPNPLFKGPSNRPLRAHGYDSVPGPGRRWARRHFARQEGTGCLLLLLVSVASAWFIGQQLGFW